MCLYVRVLKSVHTLSLKLLHRWSSSILQFRGCVGRLNTNDGTAKCGIKMTLWDFSLISLFRLHSSLSRSLARQFFLFSFFFFYYWILQNSSFLSEFFSGTVIFGHATRAETKRSKTEFYSTKTKYSHGTFFRTDKFWFETPRNIILWYYFCE